MQVSVWFERSIGRNADLVAAIRKVAQEFGPHGKWIGQYTGVNVQQLSWNDAFTFTERMSAVLREFGAITLDYVRIDVKNDIEETDIDEWLASFKRRAGDGDGSRNAEGGGD